MPASLRITSLGLGAGPAVQLSGQLNPDHLGALELPGDGHNVHSVGAAQTDTENAQTAAIEGVRVCTDTIL